jgi:hypothetical protein
MPAVRIGTFAGSYAAADLRIEAFTVRGHLD